LVDNQSASMKHLPIINTEIPVKKESESKPESKPRPSTEAGIYEYDKNDLENNRSDKVLRPGKYSNNYPYRISGSRKAKANIS
jgi:hypothetical protein